jgi:sortase B
MSGKAKGVLLVSLILLFAIVAFFLYRELKGRSVSRENLETLKEEASEAEATGEYVPGEILPKLASLHEENPDLVGWLKIPDTILDYPVMWTAGDNDYYLSHDFYGNESKSGLLVLDKRCSPDGSGMHLLIHGHNMKAGDMFGQLGDYVSEKFYLKHRTILYDTLYEEREYEVMSVFRSSINENDTDFKYYEYINFSSEDDFNIYYLNAKAASLYETGVFAVYGDELITLSTCEYSKENGRLVVIGRRVR